MKCTGGEHRKKEKRERYSVNVSSFVAYQLYPHEAKQFFPNVANLKKKPQRAQLFAVIGFRFLLPCELSVEATFSSQKGPHSPPLAPGLQGDPTSQS